MDVRKTLEQIINDTGSEFSNKRQRREAAALLRRLDDVEKKKKSDLDPATEEKMAAVAGRPVVCRSGFDPLARVLRLGIVGRSVQ